MDQSIKDIEKDKPFLVEGGSFSDFRGRLRYVNDFNMSDIKRFYIMENHDTNIVRAWHGHKFEKKYFYVISGSFIINSIEIDDWEKPSPDLVPYSNKLYKDENKILCIPSGYANGIKALEPDSALMILSNFSLDESLDDDYRFDKNLWFDWSTV